MEISKIQNLSFKNTSTDERKKKREFIDVISDSVRNPRDVNDCVAVPRGIFKAYILIMSGTALLTLSNLIPTKKTFGKVCKTSIITVGWILNTLSALYFAKPFAFRGNSPTVKKDDLK